MTTVLRPPLNRIKIRTHLLPTINQERRLLLEDYTRRESSIHIAWNMILTLELVGFVELPILTKAINAAVEKHEIFRASFSPDAEVQESERHIREVAFINSGVVYPGVFRHSVTALAPVVMAVTSAVSVNSSDEAETIEALARKNLRLPFDYAVPPLIRAHLIQLSSRHILNIFVPHLIADRLSISILQDEIIANYTQLATRKCCNSDLPSVSFSDFAAWQHQYLNTESSASATQYWVSKWSKLGIHANPLRSLISMRRNQTPTPCILSFTVDCDATARLLTLARAHRVTMYMYLLGSFVSALYQVTNKASIGVWINLTNRTLPDVSDMIGWFVNSHMLCVDAAASHGIDGLLCQIRDEVLQAIRYQDVPTAHVWRVMGHAPSTEFEAGSVQFDYWHATRRHDEELQADCGLQFSRISAIRGPRHPLRSLDVTVVERNGTLEISLLFDSSILPRDFVANVLEYWEKQLSF